jgi:delta1-piperideine-2-carboxylate reductase
MATSSLALGDIQIAARDGHELPLGTGIDREGNPTTDPNKILEGMLLPFGGYKGSHFSMMIELLAGPLVGETTSFLTKENNLDDGGPPLGGELIIAMAPEIISDLDDWEKNSEPFINKLSKLNGVRIPGKRRHKNRETRNSVEVNPDLLQKIYSLK